MPPVAGFPASGHGPCHRPACLSCHGERAQAGEGRFLPAVSPRPRRRPLGNGVVAFVVRADPNPTASFCPLCLTTDTLSEGLIPGGYDEAVGFIPALKHGAFPSNFRNEFRRNCTVWSVSKSHVGKYVRPHRDGVALFTIDTQNDFTRPGAPAEGEGTAEAVSRMRRLVEAFQGAGAPIVRVVRLYEADGSNVGQCRRAGIESGAGVVRPGGRRTGRGVEAVRGRAPGRRSTVARRVYSSD